MGVGTGVGAGMGVGGTAAIVAAIPACMVASMSGVGEGVAVGKACATAVCTVDPTSCVGGGASTLPEHPTTAAIRTSAITATNLIGRYYPFHLSLHTPDTRQPTHPQESDICS